ncbi:MAG: ATP-dependent zinc metalloprotease FtsH, partial [Candidatus Eremiobacterota bacterium]
MFRHIFVFFGLGVLLLWLFHAAQNGQYPNKQIGYSEFIQAVRAGQVKEVTIQGNKLVGKYKETPTDRKPGDFYTYFRPNTKPEPEQILSENGVPFKVKDTEGNAWLGHAMMILPYILILAFFLLLMRQAQSSGGQAFAFGRSKHKLVSENRVKVTFDDVAGVEEAKQELSEIVDYLKYPKKYQSLGARIPKGVLLLGAPGTGKTLLGRAVAGEAGVPFYYISGSDFVEMFVGVGASRVRDLFDQAKKTAPCIVFVDEIDAVGRQRGAGLGGGHDEREQTLNQLLVEMDGFEANTNVICLAATNRPDVLDPALLRPGRFDRQVVVDKPDIAGRLAILKVHSRGKPLSSDVDLHLIARRTPGFSGADLENLLNEAALLAARANRDRIQMADCEEAVDRVMMGPERKSRVIPEKEREITAYHEAGHALVARAIPEANPVRKVTIIPRGMALGVTFHIPEEDRYSHGKEELLAQVTVLMGGRVAEEIVFDEITTGASNDIERATELARDMVCRYGMSDKLGPLHFGRRQHQVFLGRDIVDHRDYSEDIAREIDREVRNIIESCYDKARKLLTEQREHLELLASELIKQEVLEEEDIDKLLGEPSA